MSELTEIRKLKNKILIDRVFKKGNQIHSGSLAMHYLKNQKNRGIYISVAVSKKEVCLAVSRNGIKRKIRACIALYQLLIKKKLISGYYMVLYKENNSEPSSSLSKNFKELIERFE